MAATAYDVTLIVNDVQLHLQLYRGSSKADQKIGRRQAVPVSGVSQPLRQGEAFAQQEGHALYRDWSGGAGFGERLAENIYHWGEPADARHPYLVMPPGRVTEVSLAGLNVNGPILGIFENGSNLYAIGGSRAIKLIGGSAAPVSDQNLADSAAFTAQSAISFDGNGYVGGVGGPIWKHNGSSGAWTQSANVRRQYFASVYWVRDNRGSQKLVGSTPPDAPGYARADRSILYSDADNLMVESEWSEEIVVGDPEFSITNLVAANQHLYVLKSNGLHDLDDRLYSPNITAYSSRIHDIVNPAAAAVHNGHVYFAGRRGIGRVSLEEDGIRQDRPQSCEFGFGLPNASPIRGLPTAMSNDGSGWLATAYWNEAAATTYLCYGIDYRDLGYARPAVGGPLLWHGAVAVLPGVQIYTIYYAAPSAANYAPRLWLAGSRSGVGTMHWISLPQSGTPIQDLRQGGPMRFEDQFVITMPRETYGNDVSRKDLTQISVRGDNLGSAVLDTYVALEGADFNSTSLGQSTSTFESFKQDPGSDVRDLTFRVKGTGTSTIPAQLLALEAQAGIYVEANDRQDYTVEFGDSVRVGNDTDRRDPFLVEETLLAMQGKRGTLTDHVRRRTWGVRVLQGISVDWEEYPSGARTGRAVAKVPVLILESTWFLDSGRRLDEGLRLG